MKADRFRALARSPLTLCGATLLVLLVLFLQAQDPGWAAHLSTDVGVYAQRIAVFFRNGAWAQLQENEYQPGALFFFLVPGFVAQRGLSLLESFFLVNAVLIVLHVAVLWVAGGRLAAWGALVLFSAAGPISFFRFELIVSLVTLLAFLAWRAGKSVWSGFLLGIAAGIKVYPLVLLPVFLWRPGGKFSWRWAAESVTGCVGGVVLLLALFGLTGGTVAHLEQSLVYHFQKPVSVQSVVAAGATLVARMQSDSPAHVNIYGIHGLDLPRSVARTALLVLLLSIGVLWAMPRVVRQHPDGDVVLRVSAMLFSVLAWSTGLQPQYLLWPLAFVALLGAASAPRLWLAKVLGLVCLCVCHRADRLPAQLRCIPRHLLRRRRCAAAPMDIYRR